MLNLLPKIWRCYNVWRCSVAPILLSSFLVACEGGMSCLVCLGWQLQLTRSLCVEVVFVVMVVIVSNDHLDPSPTQSEHLNALVGTIFLLSAATTLVTTVLIAYRIHSFCKQDLLDGSLTQFKHIVDIVIQSAVAYSAATAAFAIVSIIPNETSVAVFNARSYTACLYVFTAVRASLYAASRKSNLSCAGCRPNYNGG